MDHNGDFPAVNADLVEAQQLAEALEPEIAVLGGGKAPPGWRIDRFPSLGKVRLVSVPPWSRRPPKCEPEPWIGIGRAAQAELREAWKKEDPAGFQAQEDRRTAWLRAKGRGVVAAAVVVASPEDEKAARVLTIREPEFAEQQF